MMNRDKRALLLAIIVIAFSGPGCSVKRFAINQVGNALAGSGASYATDDDPDFIRGAAPFSLKVIESLLGESPRHLGMLQAAASGFTQYAFAFVQEDADELEDKDLMASNALRTRAKRLYARAQGYGLRGLEVRHRGFETAILVNPKQAVRVATKADVPLLYWTAAAWGSIVSLSKDDPAVLAEQPCVEALIDRAVELDESYGEGAIHSFLISYELARQGGTGNPDDRARKHFERAMALSKGVQAGPLIAFAEAVSVKNQDAVQFKALLNQALAINPDTAPQWRLVNLVMQRRARWLLSRVDELFLSPAPAKKPGQ
jgi:predicted anti-sigma-YlaC factor YlaD